MLLLSRNTNIPTRTIIDETQQDNNDIDISSYARTVTIDTYNSMKTLNSKI